MFFWMAQNSHLERDGQPAFLIQLKTEVCYFSVVTVFVFCTWALVSVDFICLSVHVTFYLYFFYSLLSYSAAFMLLN